MSLDQPSLSSTLRTPQVYLRRQNRRLPQRGIKSAPGPMTTDRDCRRSTDERQSRWQSTARLCCRSASRQVRQRNYTFSRSLGLWNECPILRVGLACQSNSYTVAPSSPEDLERSATRLRPSTTLMLSTMKYAALSVVTGLTCFPSFRQKTNESGSKARRRPRAGARRSIRPWRRTGSRISRASEWHRPGVRLPGIGGAALRDRNSDWRTRII